MVEITVAMDPSSAHPSSSLTAKYVNSNAGTTSATGFRAGYYDDGGAHEYKGIIFGRLPDKDDIYGAGVTDSGLVITGLKIVFTPSTVDVGTEYYTIRELVNQPTQAQGNLVWDGIERNTDDDGGGADLAATMQWFNAGARGNIEALGVIGTTVLGWFKPENTEAHTVELDFKAKSFVWGDKFAFVAEREGSAVAAANFFHTGTVALHITYEDPEPTAVVIKLEADTDYRSSIVTMTTKPTEKDIIEFATVWKDGGTDTFENKVGVHYSATNRVQHSGGSQFATGIFKEVDGDIADGGSDATTFLATEGETDNLVVWASDMSASGTTTSAVNRTMSNRVSHSRMSCSGSLSSGTSIGEELTLTISGFSDAGNSSAKAFKKYGVNWGGNTDPTNDIISDYTIVTLDNEVESTTVKHTFHKAGTYKINVCVIDEKGFRSDFTQLASRVIAESNPVAVLRSSRDTAVRARYGDEFSVVNLSLSHSYPIGSDRLLMTHKFKHNSNTPLTTFPMDNDNSNFNDVSSSIAAWCNTASCDDTVLKVFGKVSVDSDGDPIADDHVNFDHYEYQVNSVSPHANADSIGGVATTTDSESATVAVYYKQVDFVVISTLSGDDDGTLYKLVDIKYDHSSGDAADAGYGNIINNKIRGKKDTYAWGGYEDLLTNITAVNFNHSLTPATITRVSGSGDFITNGAVVGDTIYIASPENAGNNGFFTLSAVAGTTLTINETLVADDNSDSTAEIYKVGPSVLPIASYDANTATITASVVSTVEGQSTTANLDTSSEVTQEILIVDESQNTLDLDTVADAGDIAILSANLSRGGGMAAQMPLGNKIYPTGVIRTRMGDPTVSLSVRALTQAGYRKLWNLIEGDRYEWTTIDSKKVDAPSTAYKQLRMRLTSGSLDKDPSMASQYIGTLSFVVIGELVT